MNTTIINDITTLQNSINFAFDNDISKWNSKIKEDIETTIANLDNGSLRVMSPENNTWVHHLWVQKAILCYFKIKKMKTNHEAFLPYKDKIKSKFHLDNTLTEAPYRVVPPTHVRYGAYIAKNCVLMPCFINIGAYIDSGTMIDTWSTVGAGAQIGKNCHISGGSGIGGILEPPQAKATIIEDNCFIGARSEIAEGVKVCQGAVIAMGTFISQSTKIYDRTKDQVHTGYVPENAVVVQGSIPSENGKYNLNAAIIVKYADIQTRNKVGINSLLREN